MTAVSVTAVLLVAQIVLAQISESHSLLGFATPGQLSLGTNSTTHVTLGTGTLPPPTNVSATNGTHTDKVVITWTKTVGATGYRVYRDGVDVSGLLGDVATYDDTGADSPTITAGTASASDGTSSTYVRLLISGESANAGTTHNYTVRAVNVSETSSDSAIDTGYVGVGALSYQWQRSAADSDAAYGNIVGANVEPYNDTGGATTPDGRYYRCVMTAAGASNVTTTPNRGYMATGGGGGGGTGSSLGRMTISELLPIAVLGGTIVGIVTAMRSRDRSLGKILSGVFVGALAFVIVWALIANMLT